MLWLSESSEWLQPRQRPDEPQQVVPQLEQFTDDCRAEGTVQEASITSMVIISMTPAPAALGAQPASD